MLNNNGEPIYPILTQKIDANGAPIGGTSQDSSLRTTVENTLRQVLGWRPRRDDPKGFSTALKQSFEQIVEEGGQRWIWTPHSYTIQTEMGAVTGAQASIYNRAKVALDQSLPILKNLTSLRSDSDKEDIDASRAIIESDFTELINELGKTGGPRIQRVDALFESLLGHDFIVNNETDPEIVEGQLGKLRERMGLDVDSVNTIEEEENLTNFLILADYAISLRQSWLAQVDYFDRRGEDVFLGTQLVWINRALSTLAESVQEARFVLDSLFVGESERQTLDLVFAGRTVTLPDGAICVFDNNEQSLTIAELFDWVGTFSAEEAPRLIRDGGKDGVIALHPSLERLRCLIAATMQIISPATGNPAPGVHTGRAERAFKEIQTVTEKLYERVVQIQRISKPVIESVILSSGERRFWRMNLDINGKNFDDGVEVYILDRVEDEPDERFEGHKLAVDSDRIQCVIQLDFDTIRDACASDTVQLFVLVVNPDGEHDEYQLKLDNFKGGSTPKKPRNRKQ